MITSTKKEENVKKTCVLSELVNLTIFHFCQIMDSWQPDQNVLSNLVNIFALGRQPDKQQDVTTVSLNNLCNS